MYRAPSISTDGCIYQVKSTTIRGQPCRAGRHKVKNRRSQMYFCLLNQLGNVSLATKIEMSLGRVPPRGGHSDWGRTGLGRKELNRVEVPGRLKAGSLRLKEAAELFGVSYRQTKRVWARHRGEGAKALQHRHCGRRSNRAYRDEFRAAVLDRMRVNHGDFGPTLATGHLGSEHEPMVRPEGCACWTKAAGLWRGQRQRSADRTRRERKVHLGRLPQMDGSFHDWAGEARAADSLMHLVDDATSTVPGQFSDQATTWGRRRGCCAPGSR